jgi:hypothetical protein
MLCHSVEAMDASFFLTLIFSHWRHMPFFWQYSLNSPVPFFRIRGPFVATLFFCWYAVMACSICPMNSAFCSSHSTYFSFPSDGCQSSVKKKADKGDACPPHHDLGTTRPEGPKRVRSRLKRFLDLTDDFLLLLIQPLQVAKEVMSYCFVIGWAQKRMKVWCVGASDFQGKRNEETCNPNN